MVDELELVEIQVGDRVLMPHGEWATCIKIERPYCEYRYVFESDCGNLRECRIDFEPLKVYKSRKLVWGPLGG